MTQKRKPYSPVMFLNETETQFFEATIKLLKKNKSFELIDTYQLTQFAQCWGRYEFAQRQLHENPEELIQSFESGATNVGPYYSIMERERAMFDKLATKFGLNPKSREGLLAFKANSEDANKPKGIMAKLHKIRNAQKKVV
jgi:P27 family predicted phage terminase small subunit